ncbi:MAG: HlyD family efflux transporter periplasmic adaptor subunit [Desulfobulbaceae bacterium]|nr:HlyD family efflux transporter periplasmic adaptor subunit [Candidatus Kapabacteria bacterium]MBS4001464.1 HlyD family efflux transporter periplasmic adaptor subunit [Desulfobulbaceae bacterium]
MKKIIITIVVLALVGAAIWAYFNYFQAVATEYVTVKPKYGEFLSIATTTGELRAKNSMEIRGPQHARSVGIWQMKINKLVEEGTIVKLGDFVAELDKSEIMTKIKEIQLNIQKNESQFLQSKLDSSLTLSSARDELENLKFNMEEKKLLKEQSKYEAPSIIRQAEIDYERIERSFTQSLKNYQTKVKQAIAKINVIYTDLVKEQQKLQQYTEVLDQFTILAPAEGMVIYAREWSGRRKVVGSTVDAWYPIVATLPDLTVMESVTYVNEVDIQKIKEKQPVKISLDANPDKRITGKVVKVANIGEQKSGSNAKVFEVVIELSETDSSLLPAMTTSNEILIDKLEKALYIPLEGLHTENIENEKKYFVYKKDKSKIVKKEVKIGIMNQNEVVIESGLTVDDEILLSEPAEKSEIEFITISKNKK